MVRIRFLALILTVALAACASSGRDGSAPRPGGDRNILTRDELRPGAQPNAYEAVMALRGHWLTSAARGAPMVAVDNLLAGGVDELRQISTVDVEAVHFLDLKAAFARFGRPTNFHPVIHVILARADPS